MGLFQDVRNARFLRQQLLDGNGDFEYAFIDAEVVSKSFFDFGPGFWDVGLDFVLCFFFFRWALVLRRGKRGLNLGFCG